VQLPQPIQSNQGNRLKYSYLGLAVRVRGVSGWLGKQSTVDLSRKRKTRVSLSTQPGAIPSQLGGSLNLAQNVDLRQPEGRKKENIPNPHYLRATKIGYGGDQEF